MTKESTKKSILIVAICIALLSAITGGAALVWTDYAWFLQLGYADVFFKVLFSQASIGVLYGLIALAVLLVHVWLIKRYSRPKTHWIIPTADGGEIDIRDIVKKIGTPVVVLAAVAVAVVMGFWASRHWEEVLKLLHQTPFGEKEPILGKDVGFYLFVLPSMQFSQEWAIYLTGLSTVFVVSIYFLRGAVVMRGPWPEMSRSIRAHILLSLASVLLVIGWGFYVEMFETLFSKRGIAYGATFTDVNANLIAYRVVIAACVVCATYFVVLGFSRAEMPVISKRAAYSFGALVALYVVGVFGVPTIVQQLIVTPNELDKEKPYLINAIAGTRRAYGLDDVEVREFAANENLDLNKIEQNRTTLDNAKIWDQRPLRAAYQQLQVMRLYYHFPVINSDRYWIDNRYWQVMLSPRELIADQLPAQSQTWFNRHLQYTHGYGACLSPVTQAVGEGLPNLWVKDIPPESKYPELKITRPEIYHGLATDDYVLVKTTTQEFDYPSGNDNQYTNYEGRNGVGIGTFFRKLAFTLRFSDVNLFFTTHLTPESKILFNRNIQERINTLAPFLMLDQDPYMVISDGRLFWIQDAYTISYRYPYSQPTSLGRKKRINYIRNAVKVVVDAYHGDTTFYVWDDKDPMILTYSKIFPSLFKSKSEMPQSLQAHVRYPQDLFSIQSSMYESFHMTDPRVFYNQEDKWAVSNELVQKSEEKLGLGAESVVGTRQFTESNRMSPSYMIMKLPNEPKEEFLLMAPFSPSNKDNMVAWMTARCDGDNYGKLLVYTFPKQKLVFGPMQVEARIDQDDYISQWITLRNQQGSTVIRGDLLVIPIEDSILYVEPIYLQAKQTKLPELKQVIVAYGKRLSMKETLEEALMDVFGQTKTPGRTGASVSSKIPTNGNVGVGQSEPRLPGHKDVAQPVVTTAASVDSQTLAKQALDALQQGEQKLQHGDWAGYGAEQTRLKEIVSKLARQLESQLPPPKSRVPATPPTKTN